MALSPVYIVRGAGACFDSLSDIFSYQNRSLLVGGRVGSRHALVRHTLDDITVGYLLTSGSTSIAFSWTYMIAFTCIDTVLDNILRGESAAVRDRPKLGACPCVVRKSVLFADCVTILILVVLPLFMLWKCRNGGRGAVAYARRGSRYLPRDDRSGNAEITGTLLVCNLLVVVTYTYRFLLRGCTSSSGTDDTTDDTSASGDQDDDFTRPTRQRRTTTLNLTTVDLSLSSGYQDECEILQNGLSSQETS
ncbi:hypothetical protein BU15DRAFT_68390 [Melanogaster broomeanus]|nr:hypothetical protein BU15DRAFT_68390 [Melanogaster broomeanus]